MKLRNRPEVLEALEKQKPMAPRVDEDELPFCGRCDSNGIRQGMFDEIGGLDQYYCQFNYCADCGQKVDWTNVPVPTPVLDSLFLIQTRR